MNIVFFASDSKALSSLNSLIKESSKAGHRIFAMVTQQTQLQHPIMQKQNFQILCNTQRANVFESKTLGEQIPFRPDWLIVARERWNPEEGVIREFKQAGAKVAMVEPNSWILSNAETRLETYSRNRFKDLVDIFFMHSTHAVEQQKANGFMGEMRAVGNPKYDVNTIVGEHTIKNLKEAYFIDDDKPTHLLFSLVNQSRPKINDIFMNYAIDTSKKCFYKPYPGEPFDVKYRKDYHPHFFLPHTMPILDENHVWGMFELCDTHVGVISSIVHATLLKGKKYIDHSLELGMPEKYLDFSGVFDEGGPGIENNKAMWMRSFGFNNEKQLRDLLPDSYKERIEKTNKKVWDNLQNPDTLLTLFDDWNDGQAANRILNELQR
jgi:hypothetical protein